MNELRSMGADQWNITHGAGKDNSGTGCTDGAPHSV